MKKVSFALKLTSFIRFSLGFSIIIISAVVYIPLMVLMLPFRGIRIRMGNIYGKIAGPAVIYAIGMRPQILHRERISANYPAIYVSNHSSALDPLIAIWICPLGGCGVAKKEISYVPFFGQVYWLAGHILLDRSNQKAAIASLQEAAKWVDKYRLSLWVWPEGTRSKDGRLLPFKKGFVHMAIATGLPIVPIVVHNAHKRWASRTYIIEPGAFKIEVLPPVDTSNWTTESLDEHVEEIRNIYKDTLCEDQKPILSELK